MQPAFSEHYDFTVEANDGARLWVGDDLMFDNFDEVRSCTFWRLFGVECFRSGES